MTTPCPTRLLRLGPEQRQAFDRILELQKAPRLSQAASPAQMLRALSGLVYAALLHPDHLAVLEDPLLVEKHRFVAQGTLAELTPLFPPSELQISSEPPGSYFSGGFQEFALVARRLTRASSPAAIVAADGQSAAAPGPPTDPVPVSATGHVFRADARLVEVYATVTDGKHYIDRLPQDVFEVLEDGRPQQVRAFESHFAGVSCALLLDTTGSMQPALAALKNAALKLIGELRPDDSVAVYSFTETASLLQPFTRDKDAAKRAVLSTVAGGQTALYDALTRVSRDIAGRSGKKVIIVFTDGSDNSSALTAEAAIRRAKIVGAPIYAVAQGGALDHPVLLKQLGGVASATGGLAFGIRTSSEIRRVFESVADDLKHGYLLAYPPPPVENREWRAIRVQLHGRKDYRVRAREGYYPE